MDILNQILASGAAGSMARELGVDERTAQTGIGALLPAILGGMQQQGQGAGGIGGLASILGGLGGGGLLSNVLAPEPTNVAQGNKVLGTLFGNKDTSRAVAADAAQRSGLDSGLLKKMLPFVAMAAVGYIMNQQRGGVAPAGGGDLGGGIFGGSAPAQADAGGGLLGQIVSGALGGGGLGGNILGSILGGMRR